MNGLIIDNFAGGGGASTGIERALGRSPDVAINHDAEAVALHAANHPDTLHLCQNVWKADPREVVRQASARRCALLGIPYRELPVRFAWFSPDCKHFSKAKGSKPVEKGIRDLAWVVVHWARLVKPDVIGLENVEEFKDWGPLVETDGGKLVPCPLSKGLTFKRWIRDLKRLGYKVESRELRACDYGAPTIRKRLFVVARRDGKPIVWPKPTHAKPGKAGTVPAGMLPWRTAAECINWSLPCPSIFTRTKANGDENPLAENTLRRIARGIMRYVVNADKPFIVSAAHGGTTGRAPYVWPADEPLRTQKASGEYGVVEPFIAGVGGRMGQSPERPVDVPLQTITAKADSVVVQPFVAAYYGEGNGGKDRNAPIDEPLRTATVENRFAVVEPFVARIGQTGGSGKYVNGIDEPVTTITSKAEHLLVEPFVTRVDQTSAAGRNGIASVGEPLRTVHTVNPFALVAPHITKFRANSDGHRIDEPLHTITANSFIKRPGGAAPLGLVSAVLVPRYGERPPTFRCEACGDAFIDQHARSVGGLAPAECPRCGEESRIVEVVGRAPRARAVDEPMASVVPTQNGGSLVAAFTAGAGGPVYSGKPAPVDQPAKTLLTENHTAVVAAFLAQHNTGNDGHTVEEPVSTIVGKGCTQGLVKCEMSAEDFAGAERVAAFVAKYYSAAEHGQAIDDPLHTVTAKARFGLVTVMGWPIVDIGMRMLQPRELYKAQGFPSEYVIDCPGPTGKPMTKTAQVRMCGNSVCPPVAECITFAQFASDMDFGERAAD